MKTRIFIIQSFLQKVPRTTNSVKSYQSRWSRGSFLRPQTPTPAISDTYLAFPATGSEALRQAPAPLIPSIFRSAILLFIASTNSSSQGITTARLSSRAPLKSRRQIFIIAHRPARSAGHHAVCQRCNIHNRRAPDLRRISDRITQQHPPFRIGILNFHRFPLNVATISPGR